MSRPDLTGRKATEPAENRSASTPADDQVSGSGGLVRITVNLTPRSNQALERASRATGDSKTDTINRALQVYALIQELVERGGGSLRVLHEDGEAERIYLL